MSAIGKISYVDKERAREIFKKKKAFEQLTGEEKVNEKLKRNAEELEYLKKEIEVDGMKVNQQLKDGRTPLFFSATNGNLEAVKYLIMKGANLELAEFETGNTPLMAAIYLGHYEVIIYLIKMGANIHAKNKTGDTPNHFATILGRYEILKLLHRLGSDLNELNEEGNSCILYACGNNFMECFKYLISNNVNLDIIDCDRKHLFDLMISKKSLDEDKDLFICKFMMQDYVYAKSIEKKDYRTAFLMTVLMKERGITKAYDLLENYDVDYMHLYKNKMSAIHYAVLVGNEYIIKFMIDNMYSFNIPGLLHYCIDIRNDYFLCMILKRSNLINEFNSDYVCTPLTRAVMAKNITTAEILLLNNADPNISGSGNYSALYFAIMDKDYKMVKLLVDNGANVNNCIKYNSYHSNDGPKGDSMLKWAMRGRNQDIIKLLESKNAIIQSEF
jgi:serine/threonine-protein phosphatase 6 regulatory ankyrin repeat subunit B